MAQASTTAAGNGTELLCGSTKATWMKGAMASGAARDVQPGRHSSPRAAVWPKELGFRVEDSGLGDELQSGQRHRLDSATEGWWHWDGERRRLRWCNRSRRLRAGVEGTGTNCWRFELDGSVGLDSARG
jgi:hypothetical protein